MKNGYNEAVLKFLKKFFLINGAGYVPNVDKELTSFLIENGFAVYNYLTYGGIDYAIFSDENVPLSTIRDVVSKLNDGGFVLVRQKVQPISTLVESVVSMEKEFGDASLYLPKEYKFIVIKKARFDEFKFI